MNQVEVRVEENCVYPAHRDKVVLLKSVGDGNEWAEVETTMSLFAGLKPGAHYRITVEPIDNGKAL